MLDKQNLICDSQAVTVTAVSTNSIDLLGGGAVSLDTLGNTPDNDLGKSPELDILITVVEAFTAAGAATLVVSIVSDTAANLGTAVALVSTPAIGKATLVPGYQFRLNLPAGNPAASKYLGLSFTVATGPMTAGKITAGLVHRFARPNAPGVFK